MLSTAAALEDPDVCQHQGSHSGLKATCHWVSLLGLCGGGRQGRRQLLPSCQPSSYRHMLSLQSLVKRKMVDIVCVSSHKCTRARAHTNPPPPTHTSLLRPVFPLKGTVLILTTRLFPWGLPSVFLFFYQPKFVNHFRIVSGLSEAKKFLLKWFPTQDL